MTKGGFGDGPYMHNIWGRRWSLISLLIICLFLGMAVCRYLVIKPERMVVPEKTEKDA